MADKYDSEVKEILDKIKILLYKIFQDQAVEQSKGAVPDIFDAVAQIPTKKKKKKKKLTKEQKEERRARRKRRKKERNLWQS